MSKLEKLDLMGVSSLAAVTAALLVGWMVTTQQAASLQARQAAKAPAVTLTQEGSMKLTVMAEADEAPATYTRSTRTASVRSPAVFQVALPVAFRP